MPKHSRTIYEEVAALDANIGDISRRTSSIEQKVDKLHERIDELSVSLAWWRGRLAAIGAVLGASITHLFDRLK